MSQETDATPTIGIMMRERCLRVADELWNDGMMVNNPSHPSAKEAAQLYAQIRTGDILDQILTQLRDGGIRVSAV